VHAATELPAWAMKVFTERLSPRYKLVQKTEPSFYAGDVNGNGKSDVALLVKETTTAKIGIAIVDDGKRQIRILGPANRFDPDCWGP
jgi:hypothetical protein